MHWDDWKEKEEKCVVRYDNIDTALLDSIVNVCNLQNDDGWTVGKG